MGGASGRKEPAWGNMEGRPGAQPVSGFLTRDMPSAPVIPPKGESAATAPLDPRAVEAVTRRLLRPAVGAPGAVEGPWLAEAIARRMAERLELIRLKPAVVVDASGPLGASAHLLRAAYPDAALYQLQEPGSLAPQPVSPSGSRPWWAPWRRSEQAGSSGRLPAGFQALAADASWPTGVQLVWSNLRLGALVQPPMELSRWHDAVEPGGFVMFSALGPDTLRELVEVYEQAGWGPPAHRQTDMHDYGDMMVRAGFADPVMDQERLRLTWPDATALLRDLRALGGNVHPGRFPGWRTPRWRQRLERALASLQGSDGRLALTFEVAYGHAFRVDRRAGGLSSARFSVEELRQTARTFQSPIAQGESKAPDLG
mgnify:CR=1 FL=1